MSHPVIARERTNCSGRRPNPSYVDRAPCCFRLFDLQTRARSAPQYHPPTSSNLSLRGQTEDHFCREVLPGKRFP